MAAAVFSVCARFSTSLWLALSSSSPIITAYTCTFTHCVRMYVCRAGKSKSKSLWRGFGSRLKLNLTASLLTALPHCPSHLHSAHWRPAPPRWRFLRFSVRFSCPLFYGGSCQFDEWFVGQSVARRILGFHLPPSIV